MRKPKAAIDVGWVGRLGLHRQYDETSESPRQTIDTPETEDELPRLYVVRDGQTLALYKRSRMGFIR